MRKRGLSDTRVDWNGSGSAWCTACTCSGLAATGSAILLVLYGLAPTPRLTMVRMAATGLVLAFDGSGMWPNPLEVGGPDTAVLHSVGNAIGNMPGVLVAPVGLLLRGATGGAWMTQYAAVAALKIMAAVCFHLTVTVRPAREILQEQRLQAAAKAK